MKVIRLKERKFHNRIFEKIDCNESQYLYIKLSKIKHAGNGLYSAIHIFQDEIISIFKGTRILSLKKKKKIDATYFMNLPNGDILDCKNTACYAKYANDAEGLSISSFLNNSSIVMNDSLQICLVADKDIRKGEEIFCSYGKRYWRK